MEMEMHDFWIMRLPWSLLPPLAMRIVAAKSMRRMYTTA